MWDNLSKTFLSKTFLLVKLQS